MDENNTGKVLDDLRTPMKTVALVSGGMDSATLLMWLRSHNCDVTAVSISYGQRHDVELNYAAAFCRHYGFDHEHIDLSMLGNVLTGSALTDGSIAVPEGHYADESMKQTVVPNRNMILISVAAGFALAHGAEAVSYAAHAGDHAIYPDCRPAFHDVMHRALARCDWKRLYLIAPFLTLRKQAIVTLGHDLGIDYGITWSCYKGGQVHCGKCGTCVERREAFRLAGVKDPTIYREN